MTEEEIPLAFTNMMKAAYSISREKNEVLSVRFFIGDSKSDIIVTKTGIFLMNVAEDVTGKFYEISNSQEWMVG